MGERRGRERESGRLDRGVRERRGREGEGGGERRQTDRQSYFKIENKIIDGAISTYFDFFNSLLSKSAGQKQKTTTSK